MKKLILISMLLLAACSPKPQAGQCYHHKLTQSTGLIMNVRRGDSIDENNPVVVVLEPQEETCITWSSEYEPRTCTEKVQLGPYRREFYYQEVNIIPCTGIVNK